ncbi:MAG: PAS domain S-box protein [Bacteroidota bacterium]|jgi:PAS domain S-box-containing protein
MNKTAIDKTSLRVLYLEDSPQVVEIIRELLIDAGYDFNMDCTEKKKEFASFLRSGTYDIILSDFNLPEFDGFEALRLATDICPEVPFICVSGSIGEETAIEIIKQGAVDYILKDRMLRLPSAINRALDQAKEKNARRRAEESLRESEDRYRNIVELSPDPIFVHSDGKIVFVNSAALKLFGAKAPDEIVGKSALDFVHPDYREFALNRIQKIYSEGLPSTNAEEKFIRFDGTTIDVEVSSIPCTFSGRKAVQGVIRDITERKRAEENVRKLSRAVEQSPASVIITDIKGDIEYVNPKFTQLTGYTLEEVSGKNPRILQSGETLHDQYTHMWKLILAGMEWRGEFHNKKKNGELYWESASLSPIFDENSTITHFLAVKEDITERKRAEEELRETRDYLENLLSFANAPIMVWDSDFKITRFNLAFERLTGYTMYDVLGMHPEILFPVDMREDLSALISRTSDGENLISIEMPIRCKDGSVRTVVWNTANIYATDDKTIIATIAHGQDITNRKLAEEALQESELRFRSLYENATVGLYRTTPDGNILLANPALVKMLGYTSFQKLAERNLEKDGFESSNQRKKFLEKIERDGEINGCDSKWIRQDGTAIFVLESARAVRDSQGKTLYYDGTVEDITERKRAEEDIRKLSSAVEQSGSSIIVTNLKGDIEYVNSKFVELTGYSAQEAIGQNPRILRSGHTSNEEYKIVWDTITNGQMWRGEFYNKKKNGELYWESATISPVKDSDGNITQFIAVEQDITEQKMMADQMRQMQKLEGLGTLAGGIAHDFNNILGIILAYITSIKRFIPDPKKLDLAIDTITKAVERGKALVKQILTFARKTRTEFGTVNVNDVVLEIMVMISETFPKILTYAQNLDNDISYINADRSQLHQALLNLCVNARDSMPNGGLLAINTSMVTGIILRNQHSDAGASSYVCIEVVDTGEGMTPEIRNRIFEPFFTTKEQGKGTGLGLAVVFGVVQAHKGFVDVVSEPGKGTTIRLYLPASRAAEPIGVKDEEALEEIPGGTETLLVVEDEETLMMTLRMLLLEKGYNILSAEDGLTAVNIYKEQEEDVALVITDLGLPKMGGMEVCAQIKKLNPKARIIVTTGYLAPEIKSEFLKAGIQQFLYKPYDFKKVLKVVREVLDKK